MHIVGCFVHWRSPEASCSFPVPFRWNKLVVSLVLFSLAWLVIAWAFTNNLMAPLLRWISICFSTFLLLGQPWLVPSASSVLSGVLGQLSKCRESSGKHEFAHKHTPLLPLSFYTTYRSCSNLHAEQVDFCVRSSQHHILLQGYGPHTLILPTIPVTNKVIFCCCCLHIQTYLTLLSPETL